MPATGRADPQALAGAVGALQGDHTFPGSPLRARQQCPRADQLATLTEPHQPHAFFVGIVLAYISLPLVNGLNRLLPRSLAVLLVMAAELGLFIFLVGTLGPPLLVQIAGFLEYLPSPRQLRGLVDRLVGYFQELPEPTRAMIRQTLEPTATRLRAELIEILRTLLNVAISSLIELVNASGFILSFLIVPTWLFAVLFNHQAGRRALEQRIAPWLQADFWAVVRIVDRPLRAFLGGQVVMGLSVGTLNYLALLLIERLGLAAIEFPLLLAIIAGVLQSRPPRPTIAVQR